MNDLVRMDKQGELTIKQTEFVNAWLRCNESPEETRKAMRWTDRGQVSSYRRIPKVQAEIARRKSELADFVANQDNLAGVSKEMKAELLWEVAQACAERGFDKMGNSILVNPQATIQAIRELNLMVGHHAPTITEQKVEVTHRSEEEVRARIAELTQQYKELVAIDGECEKI